MSLLVAGCGRDKFHRDGARTYYESLDLSSPEAAVETFTDAFARDDFMTVWMVLDPFAHVRLSRSLNLLQYSEVVGPDATDDLQDWMHNEFSFETMEGLGELLWFDQLMLIADRNDAFLVDLSGTVEIGTVAVEDHEAVVTAEVEGQGTVEFFLTVPSSGRWKISRVFVPVGIQEWPADSSGN
jgi:hypothetical protein